MNFKVEKASWPEDLLCWGVLNNTEAYDQLASTHTHISDLIHSQLHKSGLKDQILPKVVERDIFSGISEGEEERKNT